MSSSERSALLASCLEDARREIVRRLRHRGFPTSVEVERQVVRENDEGTGWRSEEQVVRVSPLQFPKYQLGLSDGSWPGSALGLGEQLYPLAEHLDRTTHLGEQQRGGLHPDETGPEAVLRRVCGPLTQVYLGGLRDVRRGSRSAVARLDSELTVLCEGLTTVHTRQLALSGLRIRRALGPYRGVSLRRLTAAERGAFVEATVGGLQGVSSTPEIVVPQVFSVLAPSTLIEVRTERPRGTLNDSSRLMSRVALALFISGYSVASPGRIVGWDEPRWASFGISSGPFPIEDRLYTELPMSRGAFERMVDLAHRIPDFSGLEGSRTEVALYRVLRGCGSQGSGFLDFAIALEALLVPGSMAELSYRFRLNGALYLRGERDPLKTYEALRNIYNVRSKLVHGEGVTVAARVAAEKDAAELAVAVARKAVADGWPEEETFRGLALGERKASSS